MKRNTDMIEGFRKSRLGQTVMTAFVVGSVVAGVICWVYENIRLPTLAGQLSYRDTKITDLEAQITKVTEATKLANAELETEKLRLAGWRSTSEQGKVEVADLSGKLKRAQEECGRLAGEVNSLQLRSSEAQLANTNETVLGGHLARGFEQALLLTADQEDAAFLLLDKNITEIRLASYAMYSQEFEKARSQRPSSIADISSFTSNLVAIPRGMWDLRSGLERMRAVMTRDILNHYRQKLAASGRSSPSSFLSEVRQKPACLAQVAELTRKLHSNENATAWNVRALNEVETLLTPTNMPAVGP